MITLSGTYTTSQLDEDYAFCIQAQQGDQSISIPIEVIKGIEDFGWEDESHTMCISRVRMAEFFLELNRFSSLLSTEILFWHRLFHWSKSLAVKGSFYPGLKKQGESYYSQWLVDWSRTEVREQVEYWAQEGLLFLKKVDDPWLWMKSFVEDCVDSYIRFVINTRISLKHSQLGKLLIFKPFYLHEDWLQRLCTEEHLPGEGKRWQELYESFLQWRGQQEEQEKTVGRVCLRLEPSQDEQGWAISYYWMEPTGQLVSWEELNPVLKNLFLAELAQAAEFYPVLADRWESVPYSSQVTMQEAHQFLKKAAPVLRSKGYAVLAPQSLLQPHSKWFSLRLQLDSPEWTRSGEMGLESLLSFQYQIALGDQELTTEEWEKLTSSQDSFYQVNGEWMLFDADEIKRSVQWVNQYKKKKELTLRDAVYFYAVEEDPELFPMPIRSVEASGWIKDWFQWLKEGGKSKEYPLSSHFKGELRPYQQVGMSWLIELRNWGMGACLADDMGLGKTIQFLSYLAYCKEQKGIERPFLLICPTSVLGNWQREIQRFMPALSVLVHHGPQRWTNEKFSEEALTFDLILTTYSLIQRDHAFLSPIKWDGVILDEAQHIKNPSSLQSKVIRKLRGGHRIALTGTPMENRLDELWSIFEFLNPGFLGSQAAFRRQFAIPIEKQQDKKRMESLKSLIRPFLLRRSKTDPGIIQDLPDKVEKKEYCYLTGEQAALYEKVVQEVMQKEKQLTGLARKGLILSTILKLKQICNHPSLFLHHRSLQGKNSGKLGRMLDMVEEMISEDDRMLIFTQFSQMGLLLQQLLEEKFSLKIPFLHGGVSAAGRDEMIEQFQKETGGPPILLLSLKAGGVGLNLTRANRVIHFDRWWNPAVENQATDRAYRIGQTRTVHVHKLICMGTIEEKIDLMIERKLGLAMDMMGTGESWITELSSNDLQELLSLHNQLIDDL